MLRVGKFGMTVIVALVCPDSEVMKGALCLSLPTH